MKLVKFNEENRKTDYLVAKMTVSNSVSGSGEGGEEKKVVVIRKNADLIDSLANNITSLCSKILCMKKSYRKFNPFSYDKIETGS